MAKPYTAQEMREVAKHCIIGYYPFAMIPDGFEDREGRPTEREVSLSEVCAMLRQAADLMEREEKREKKYEYACFGRVFQTVNGARVYAIANEFQGRRPTIVRREIGRWEEVK